MLKKNGTSMAEYAADQIVDYITQNRMKPGDKMPTEAEMIKRLSVGRSTLREAFKIMSARNILEVRQGSGAFISEKCGIPADPLGLTFVYDDDRLVLDLLDVRALIEPHAAMLAALHATSEQKRCLKEKCKEVETLIHQQAVYENEDIELHKMIVDASGNVVIRNLSYILNNSIKWTIAATKDAMRENNTLIYHRKTVEAILEGDPVGARNSMMIHVNLLREYVADKIKMLENSRRM